MTSLSTAASSIVSSVFSSAVSPLGLIDASRRARYWRTSPIFAVAMSCAAFAGSVGTSSAAPYQSIRGKSLSAASSPWAISAEAIAQRDSTASRCKPDARNSRTTGEGSDWAMAASLSASSGEAFRPSSANWIAQPRRYGSGLLSSSFVVVSSTPPIACRHQRARSLRVTSGFCLSIACMPAASRHRACRRQSAPRAAGGRAARTNRSCRAAWRRARHRSYRRRRG